MSDPLVSVVVPAYGRPEKMTDAVRTVGDQTYEPIELIVVDDCSPTPIEPHLDGLDLPSLQRVEVYRHDENRGAAGARRTGIEESVGEFVAFLDDDDRWRETKIETQVEAIEGSDSNVGISYTGMRVVDESGDTVRTHVPNQSGNLTRTLLCRNVVGSYSTVLVKRTAIEDAGLPDERFPTWQDLEWYIRLSENWEFVAVAEPLAIIFQSESHDQMSDDFRAIRDETYPLFVESFRPLAAEYGTFFERKMRAWAAFRVGGYNALRTGNFREARRFLLRAVSLYPLEVKFWIYLGVSLGGARTYEAATRIRRRLLS